MIIAGPTLGANRLDNKEKNKIMAVHDRKDDQLTTLTILHRKIAACRVCHDCPRYPPPYEIEPRPIAVLSSCAPIAISGQAPGLKVHESGIPFNDASGNRLRDWMGVNCEEFYDSNRFAIIPMGFCFPGYNAKGSDLPPRRECREIWHEQVFSGMPQIQLVLTIGQYAQHWHIDDIGKKSVTETVANWQKILNTRQSRGYRVLPLPHPSWRNTGWIKKNPWFSEELLPELKRLINNARQEKL